MRHLIVSVSIAAALLLSACGKKTPDKPVEPIATGRDETQGIRRTDAIGYSGSAIANKVDGALNANDKQMEKTDDAVKNAE